MNTHGWQNNCTERVLIKGSNRLRRICVLLCLGSMPLNIFINDLDVALNRGWIRRRNKLTSNIMSLFMTLLIN